MSINANNGPVDFKKTFGSKTAAAPTDRPKAQFWLNIGYDSGIEDDQGNPRFVSLPQGIPLDGQEHLPTNSRNSEFAAFQSARNDLYDQLMQVAQSLAPGEEKIVNLAIQLRRVNEEAPAIAAADNPFARKIDL